MQTVLVELKNQKAYKLLKDLEGLQLIRLVKTPAKLSALRQRVNTPMADAEIDKQLAELRNEAQRGFERILVGQSG